MAISSSNSSTPSIVGYLTTEFFHSSDSIDSELEKLITETTQTYAAAITGLKHIRESLQSTLDPQRISNLELDNKTQEEASSTLVKQIENLFSSATKLRKHLEATETTLAECLKILNETI